MKFHLTVLVVTLFLAMGIYASFAQISAQGQTADFETTAPSAIIGQTGNTSGITTTADGFNLLWLLPLIAIPILAYLIWPRREEEHRTDLAGIKGGRAQTEEYYDEEEGKVVTREKT